MEGGSRDNGQLPPSNQPGSSTHQIDIAPVQPTQPARTRVGRKSTCIAKLTLRNSDKVKILFDNRRFMPIGPNKGISDNWSSYLCFLGRKEPSILICSWKKIPATTKELEKFNVFLCDGDKEIEFSENDVKMQSRFKKKWIAYVGCRWDVFKTNLTTDYIYGDKKDPPYVTDYKFVDKPTWDAFVALRLSPEEKAKRKKAQEIQSHNKCPQRTSRGGYDLLEKKMIEEKIKERQEASEDPTAMIPPPSPPTRHERWKRARISTSGQYTTSEVGLIAEKIDSLEEQQSSGTFQSSGTNDLLAVAIGKPDHPNRVRGVGRGYTVSTYFGKQRNSSGMMSREEFNKTIAEMERKLQMVLSSQAFSGSEPISPAVESGEHDDMITLSLYVNPHSFFLLTLI
ncbi:hypothetical protein CASFOL_011204 [Castilleja foliolosa]|uniref:Transposase, Ptta/En/Spm, plant n=1 Tax=Castilleja foliolosa TaxID=1961234 RepID=A0ABD3DYL2_9LAMI